ncbi:MULTISPECIES: hypothetical protein [unclassified Caballeronia]|uniref:hypothetical protein n=1 Tax=unclassified Caballeronia TaxID=2646786 RepID=UPI00158E08B6|nr:MULTISPECIES: hypothetical protein [unclassified Caballeronia]QSN61674.1 hypothetical protein JYK05_01765 [Caballeronia sp. M1242]
MLDRVDFIELDMEGNRTGRASGREGNHRAVRARHARRSAHERRENHPDVLLALNAHDPLLRHIAQRGDRLFIE